MTKPLTPPIPPAIVPPPLWDEPTGRVEWDGARGALLLRAHSRFWPRLRCDLLSARFNRTALLPVLLGWPIMAALLATIHLVRMGPRRVSTELHAWGARQTAPEVTVEFRWDQLRQLDFYHGSIFFSRGAALDFTVPREEFADEAEARRFFEAAHALWKSRGANFDEVSAGFRGAE